MGQAYFITGTGTDIGKTIATSVLFMSLQAIGKRVTILKPFQTGLIEDTNTYPDISWYEQELGVKETGLYMLAPETSPHLAIKLTGQQIDVQKIINRINELQQQYDIVLVEGAGGLAVPLIERPDEFYMTKDLIKDAGLPLVFISPSGLGAIHNVVTAYTYAKLHRLDVRTIVFNHFRRDDQIHRDNIATIESMTGLTALAHIPTLSDAKTDLRDFVSDLLKNNDYMKLLKEVFL